MIGTKSIPPAGCSFPSLQPGQSLKQSKGLYIYGLSYPPILSNLQLEMVRITKNPQLSKLLSQRNFLCLNTYSIPVFPQCLRALNFPGYISSYSQPIGEQRYAPFGCLFQTSGRKLRIFAS